MRSIKAFLSYSHKDKDLKNVFVSHFSSLERTENIDLWTDDDILAGTRWNDKIQNELVTSDLVLLLISPDFIASDYAYKEELEKVINQSHRSKIIVPIGLRSVDMTNTVFSSYQMLPTDPRFVESWPNQDEGFTNVIQGLRKTIVEFKNGIPTERKEKIQSFLENAEYEEACNKMIDLVRDFTKDDDLVFEASQIRSDYTDYKLLREKAEKEKEDIKYSDKLWHFIKEIKQKLYALLKKIMELLKGPKTTLANG